MGSSGLGYRLTLPSRQNMRFAQLPYYIISVSSLNGHRLRTKIAQTYTSFLKHTIKSIWTILRLNSHFSLEHTNFFAMTDATFHTTREDLRKAESKVSQKNDGNVPADSEVSLMKVSSQTNTKTCKASR